MDPIVGIDLGTTNSEIAFIYDGHAEILMDSDDGIVPSCVGLDGDGKIVVGREALNQAAVFPEKTVLSVKRSMGSDDDIPLGDVSYKPQEISAFILKALKERAERILKKKVEKAVVTVPAYFTDVQRQATREAGRIAGLDVVRIVNEPTAASLAYESLDGATRKILVYDLGGGTFDVSIVKIEQGVVEVLASTGDNRLGGDDFDAKIVDRLVEHLESQFESSPREDPLVTARLRQAAEKAKKELSFAPFAMVEEDHIGKGSSGNVHLKYELSRTDFLKMIENDLSRTMDSVGKALEDAGTSPAGIDKIILVGGSTRIPAIAEMLEEKIGKAPRSEVDPDLCVALGAAIQAGREMGVDHTGILLDITPYTFGTSCIGVVDGAPTDEEFVPLIRRNSKLPVSRSDVFLTFHDRQAAVEVLVYQGENKYASQNVRIGNFMFKLSKLPQNSEIVLKMDLDVNGILKIHAVEKETGKYIDGVIEGALREFSDEELERSKSRVESAWGPTAAEDEGRDDDSDSSAADSAEIPDEYKWLFKRAEEKLDAAPPEDRDEIANLLEDLKDALGSGQSDQARKIGDELEEILFYIE